MVPEALRCLGVAQAGLKWPNDVLTPDGKLCGILVELGAASKGRVPVVAGIGINVRGRVKPTPGIEQPWTSAIEYADVSRNALAMNLMPRLEQLADTFQSGGFEHYRQRWDSLCVHRGQVIRILRGEQVIEGRDAGIDSNGNLLLETADGVERYEAGEVSLRAVTS